MNKDAPDPKNYFNELALRKISQAGGSPPDKIDDFVKHIRRKHPGDNFTHYVSWLIAGMAAGYIENDTWENIELAQSAAKAIIVAFSANLPLDDLIVPTSMPVPLGEA